MTDQEVFDQVVLAQKKYLASLANKDIYSKYTISTVDVTNTSVDITFSISESSLPIMSMLLKQYRDDSTPEAIVIDSNLDVFTLVTSRYGYVVKTLIRRAIAIKDNLASKITQINGISLDDYDTLDEAIEAVRSITL